MMSFWTLVLISFGLACAALFLFMMAAFGGGGAVQGNDLGKGTLLVINLSIYLLPALCVIAAVAMWIAYANGLGTVHYWWTALPAPFVIVYIIFMVKIMG